MLFAQSPCTCQFPSFNGHYPDILKLSQPLDRIPQENFSKHWLQQFQWISTDKYTTLRIGALWWRKKGIEKKESQSQIGLNAGKSTPLSQTCQRQSRTSPHVWAVQWQYDGTVCPSRLLLLQFVMAEPSDGHCLWMCLAWELESWLLASATASKQPWSQQMWVSILGL